jgi:alpha-1,2-mannosyltransferase
MNDELARRASRSGKWWLAVTLFLFFEGSLIYRYGYRQEGLFYIDLPSFYLAATTTFSQGASPYDYPTLRDQGPTVNQHVFPFLYPPTSLLPLYPLRFLTYGQAKVVTLAANHLLVLAVVVLLARLVPFRSHDLGLFVGAFLVASDPIVQTLAHSQTNLALLALLLLAWWALRANRAMLAGTSLALAILIKPTPVVLLVYLIARRAWRALAIVIGVLAVALFVSVLVLPDGVWGEWISKVRPTLGYGLQPTGLFSPACNFNQSLNGFVARLFLDASCLPTLESVPLEGRLVAYALAAAVLGASVLVAWRAAGQAALDLGFCLFLLAMFLTATLAWEHHLVFALPAVVLLLQRQHETGTHSAALLAAVLGTTLPLPIYHGALETGWPRLFVSARTFSVVALWLLALVSLSKERRASVAATAGAQGVARIAST